MYASKTRRLATGAIAFAIALAAALPREPVALPHTAESHPLVTVLQSTGKTILGQPFAYPKATPAKVTAVIVSMKPGEETGWHKHDVPLFGYILEGELTVDYGKDGTRTYKTGDSLIEAFKTPHNGRNTGNGDMRVLAVFMGADGVPNTTPIK